MARNTRSIDFERSSSQYLSANDSASLSFTGDFTIEAWVRLEQLPSTAGGIFSIVSKYRTSPSPQRSYWLNIDSSNKVNITYRNEGIGSDSDILTTAAAVDADDVAQWVHIAAAVDVSAIDAAIYKNTVALSVTTAGVGSTAVADTASPLLIGAVENPQLHFMDGMVDEVRIWNTIRSSAQISANYRRHLVGNESGLVAYYRFNNTLLDQTANDNDLTAVNGPTYNTSVPFRGPAAGFITALL